MINFDQYKGLIRHAAQDHFWAFCNYMDYDFFQKRHFLKPAALKIQELYDKKIRRLSISMPPRAGKSYLASMAAAYFIGKRPTESVMRNSCTATLYNKFSYDVRDIVKSEKFKQVFPNVSLSEDKTAVTGWNVKKAKQVTYFGNGVGGTIIGFGASNIAITDDLYKSHEDALSETINEKTHRWHESAHTSRIEGDCVELDIGTRWHKGDIIGTRMERNDYDDSIIIPALDENNHSFCEDVKTTSDYIDIKKITDPFIWESEYMQNPIDDVGLLFPPDKIKKYDHVNEGGITIGFIDTADAGEDYFSMPIIKWFENDGYLVDCLFNLYLLSENENLVIAKAQEYNLDYLVVETNKEGSLFVNNLRKVVSCPVYGQFNTAKKTTRIMAQSGFIMDRIRFKKEYELGSDYDKFMRNLTTYLRQGTSKHDDAPDSLAGAISFIRQRFI